MGMQPINVDPNYGPICRIIGVKVDTLHFIF
jgi:hypothetical protein